MILNCKKNFSLTNYMYNGLIVTVWEAYHQTGPLSCHIAILTNGDYGLTNCACRTASIF